MVCSGGGSERGGEEKKDKNKSERGGGEVGGQARGAGSSLNKHFLCFSSVKAVFNSTCDIYLNHKTGKHNSIF